jgi:tetratricopeptide (TPR) repeat protein
MYFNTNSKVPARRPDVGRPDAFEFVQSDVAEVYPKAKHMNLVDYAEGMAVYLAAAGPKSMGPRERLRLLNLSCARFARALSTLPDSYVTLYQWGLSLLEESKLHSDFRKVLESASEKFSAALEIKPNFQGCWVKLAEVLIEIAKLTRKPKRTTELLKQASDAFDKALSSDDFFLDVAIKKVQESREEAVNQRCAFSVDFHLLSVRFTIFVTQFPLENFTTDLCSSARSFIIQ